MLLMLLTRYRPSQLGLFEEQVHTYGSLHCELCIFLMIYPYLQHCSLVWSSIYPTNLSRLVYVVLQKRVVRIINKSDFLAHTSPIFKELHLLKLQDIRILQICQFMFSYENKKLPYKFQVLHNPPVRTNYR